MRTYYREYTQKGEPTKTILLVFSPTEMPGPEEDLTMAQLQGFYHCIVANPEDKEPVINQCLLAFLFIRCKRCTQEEALQTAPSLSAILEILALESRYS